MRLPACACHAGRNHIDLSHHMQRVAHAGMTSMLCAWWLHGYRKNGKFVEEDQAWQWLVQLLLSLSYCHSKKILHRDVKTQVVLLLHATR